MTEAQQLMFIFSETRSLTHYYFGKIRDKDLYHVFESEGKPLNSAAWILAHTAWAENFLLLQALGGPALEVDWFGKVAFGSPMAGKEDLPDIETILEVLNRVHETAAEFVNNLGAEVLEEDNLAGLKFGPNTSKRYMIIHAIRHEGIHAGHMGWLAKLHTR